MKLRAGEMAVEVTVEEPISTPDPVYGTPVITWTALSYLPGSPLVAEKFPATIQDARPSRDERLVQNTVIATKRATIRMRWRDDIDSSMRVIVHKDTDKTYQIISPAQDIDGRKQRIEFIAEWISS